MTDFGAGAVLPPGSLGIIDLGNAATLTLVIEEVQTEQSFGDPVQYAPLDTPIVRIAYPDGFVKHHEAADLPSLMTKVQATLRGRYGVTGFAVASTPGMAAGNIELENLTYGS